VLLLPGISRIFPHDFFPRQRRICIRKWLNINGMTFWPFNAAVRLAAGFDSESGPGMAQAIKEARKSGQILATCVEAEEPHLRFLKEGVLTACVGQKRELFTYLGVKSLFDLNHAPIKFSKNDKAAGVAPIASNYNTGTYTVTRETVDFFLGAASQ
jgi:ABC-type sugar transport system substrate-binding protein